MKRTLSVAAVTAALMLAPLGVADAAPAYFRNCTEAEAAGRTNIPANSPDYRPALDRDHDGFACDRDRGHATDGAGNSGNGGHSGAGGSFDEGTSDEGNSDESGTASGADEDQVGIVPEGGAPTGDGSTESGLALWVGGGLLVAATGVGVALRRRGLGRP